MKRYLITGGCGFIGSAIARALIAEGYDVVAVDNLTTGNVENLPDEADFIELDLCDETFLNHLPDVKFDAVLHLAAQSSGELSQELPAYDVKSNALSTLLLSRWSLENGCPRFLYASSMSIYGDVVQLPVTEEAVCAPLSYYGVSKLASEHYLRIAQMDGLSPTSLRMFSVYGPGQNLDNLKQGMLSIYLTYLLKNEALPVSGSRDRFRDFVYIDDVVDVWLRLLKMASTPSAAYNIGSGGRCTVGELIERLIDALGLPANHPVEFAPNSANDQLRMQSARGLAARELSWSATPPLSAGLASMIEWARERLSSGST